MFKRIEFKGCELVRAEEWYGHKMARDRAARRAYYQWRRALSFSDIEARVPIEDVLALYEPYHEMDEQQFLDRMDEECARVVPATKLQSCRK